MLPKLLPPLLVFGVVLGSIYGGITEAAAMGSVAPPHVSLPDIFRGFLPFIGIQLLVLGMVSMFPELTRFYR